MVRAIGDYRVVRELGRGGMGAVYLADDPLLERRVAIKVIAGYRDHPSARARFLVEARAIARLNHPNVVAIHRIGEHDGEPYLVSEFVDGTTLDRLQRPIDAERLRAIALGVTMGVAAAHREGILHRDIKPSNAIVTADGTVKILDFGLAKLEGRDAHDPVAAPSPVAAAPSEPEARRRDRAVDVDATRTFTPDTPDTPDTRGTPERAAAPSSPDATPELTQTGARLGTPRYMAPEAWRGDRLTAASDVFSLGVLLWELHAGRHPLADVEPGALAAASAAIPALPVDVAAPAVAAVIARATAAAPADRFVDGAAMASALAAAYDRAAAPAVVASRDLPSPAAIAATIAIGASAVAALTWIVWPSPSRRHAPAPAATPADVDAPLADPVKLTSLGACASQPTFVDATTVAFTVMRGDEVDVHTLTPGAAPMVAIGKPLWDWQPSGGRHPGELLFVTDDLDDGRNRIKALSRATGVITELAAGYSVTAAGRDLFYLTDDDPGWVRRLDASGDARLIQLDGPLDVVTASTDGATLAIERSDRLTPPSLCLVDVGAAAVRCVPTVAMVNGRAAFSTDGRALYYPSRGGLRRLDLGSGQDRLLGPGIHGNGGLAVSPDGARLVFSDCRSYGSLVAVGTGAPEVLVDAEAVRSPVAAPAGALAYVERVGMTRTRIVIRRDRTTANIVVEDDGELGRPAFSPDGGRMAYARVGTTRGIWVLPLTGGVAEAWTGDASDRDPVWLPGDRLAFTRIVDDRPRVWIVERPGAAPRMIGEGVVQGAIGARLLVMLREDQLLVVDPDTGASTRIPIGELEAQTLMAARPLPDGAIAVTTAESNAVVRLEPATGATTVLYQRPAGQTAGPPSVLPDGRVAFRAEIWLGELYELPGPW